MNTPTQFTDNKPHMHRALATCCIALSCFITYSPNADAVTVSWDTPVNIAGDSDINKEGTLIAAWSLRQNGNGPNGSGISAPFTVNGVAFTNVTNAAGSGNLAVSASAGSILPYGLNNSEQTLASATGTSYASLTNVYKALNFQSFLLQQGGSGKNITLTVSGLQANKTYSVQIWSSWPKSTGLTGGTKCTVNGATSLPLDASVTDAYGGVGQYITGTLITGASETQASIVLSSGDPTNANAYIGVNAIQVREVTKTTWLKSGQYGVGIAWGVGINDVLEDFDPEASNRATLVSNFAKKDPVTGKSAWAQIVEDFDVDDFVGQVQASGASYVLFPVSNGLDFYCSWNAVYEASDTCPASGGQPAHTWPGPDRGEFTPYRDLIADLGTALNAKGIRLIVYIASEGPFADYYVERAPGGSANRIYPCLRMHSRDGIFDGPDAGTEPEQRVAYSQKFRDYWHAMISEWSVRWGTKVSGWWIDGVYNDNGYRTVSGADNGLPATNLSALIAACKAGNPDAVVAANPMVDDFSALSENQDYVAGEHGRYGTDGRPSSIWGKAFYYPYTRYISQGSNSLIQNQVYTYLGKWWAGTTRKYVDEEIINYISSLNVTGVPVTLSIGTDAEGVISDETMAQLERVKSALRPATVPAVTPRPVPSFVNMALFKPAYMLAYQGNLGDAREAGGPGAHEHNHAHAGVDGDLDTYSSTGATSNIGFSYLVDLESSQTFDRVVVTFKNDSFSTQYKIEYSATGLSGSWSLIDSTASFYYGSTGGVKVHNTNGAKTARYVRISSLMPSGVGQTGVRMAVEEFGVYNTSASLPATKETVWVDEEWPSKDVTESTVGSAGWQKANAFYQNPLDVNDPLNWSFFEADGVPYPLHGMKLHWNNIASGAAVGHGFVGTSAPLRVSSGDSLYCDVFIDNANPTTEICLKWVATDNTTGSAYWRASGGSQLSGSYSAGVLPGTNAWHRLSAPVSSLGLAGKSLKSMSFENYGGRVFFDRSGKTTP